MDRLFLGFHIKLTLSLLCAGLLALLLIAPRADRQLRQNVESTLSIPMHIMAESLAVEQTRSPGPSKLLADIQARYGVPAVLIAKDQLSGSAEWHRRLDRGEVVADDIRGRPNRLYVRVGDTNQVARIGPLAPINPLGQGRGIGILLLIFGGLSLGVYLLVRPLRRRLAALSSTAARFGRGKLTARAIVDTPDAIGRLAADFNQMAQQIERLVASQRELLHMVSHELRTPMQRMHFALDKVRDADITKQQFDGVQGLESELRELDTLLEELLTYVRLDETPSAQREMVFMPDLVDEVIAMQVDMADEISLVARPAPNSPASNSPARCVGQLQLLRRALANLIKNAVHHARSRVEVTISQQAAQLHIDVDDDGAGIPKELREQLFRPFSRLEIQRERGASGSGLGLAIVKRIATQHDGDITVAESPLGGARFRLSLPLVSKAG